MQKILGFVFMFLLQVLCIKAENKDTIKIKVHLPVTVEANVSRNSISRLDPIVGTYVFSGKKNEVLNLSHLDANITEKTARQIFAKIPGLFVYDMEGGNQINISSRGLDPHRSWEFNMRKDGIIINSDLYAYPASHYSIPMESVKRIELVRGTGSLQYGAQFGGMLNYVSKQGDTSKPISFENFSTIGSFNLISSYYAIGGKVNKIKYYAYVSKRSRGGYRDNEHSNYDAEGVNLTYESNSKFSLRLDYARSSYLYQLPGPLTDAQFDADPRQATRARNYFSPTIHIPSITLKWDINKNSKIHFVSSALLGIRNSVLFDKSANIKDSINAITNQYNNRQVDIDRFNSYTQELRFLQQYNLKQFFGAIVAGVQVLTNNLHRTQLGKGTTGSDYDVSLVDPNWGRDIYFKTNNLAFFAENSFKFSRNFTINLGARLEIGESKMSGKIVYYPDNKIPLTIAHKFPLFGASFNYMAIEQTEFYGGVSQAYRPMIFKDLVPASVYEKVNPNLKDAFGYNAELGFRGKSKFLNWDISGFMLQENNRFGTLGLMDSALNFYAYRTNIGNSLTKGIEVFVQVNYEMKNKCQFLLYTSTSVMDGRYVSGSIKSGNENKEIAGNKIESVPTLITRNGFTFQYLKLSTTLQYSYTGKTFSDAFNTNIPNASGAVGLTPAYGILDFNFTYKLSKNLEFKGSLNNVLNKQYFTKRPLFYPGPGIWSSDGRSATFSVVFRV